MKSHALPLLTFTYSMLVSALALAAGVPFDDELALPLPDDEVAVMHYISACSPATTPGLRICQEKELDLCDNWSPLTGCDGITDLIVGVNQEGPKRFYSGRGEGLFNPPRYIEVFGLTSDLKVADLDNDGDLDMVETVRQLDSDDDTNIVYVNYNNTLASLFTDEQPLDGTTNRSSSAAVGDVNNDGKLDIVVANETPDAQSLPNPDDPYTQKNYVYLNRTAAPNVIDFGSAIEIDTLPSHQAYTRRVLLIDVEGDGDLDLVATSADNHLDDTGNGNVLYVNHCVPHPVGGCGLSNPFDAPVPLNANAADETDVANAIAAGDLDGDGDPDLVFSTWSRMNGVVAEDAPDRFYINNSTVVGGPNFETTNTFGPFGNTASHSTNVELGDFNKDGRLDAVVVNYNTSAGAGDPNRLHLNTLTPTPFLSTDMGLPIVVPPGHGTQPIVGDLPRGLDSADLNEDTWLDLVIVNRGQLGLRYLNCPGNSARCDTLNRFENDGPGIIEQTGTPNPVPVNAPIDIGSEANLSTLSVTDHDNVYPADFRAVLPYPPLNNNYSCTDPPSLYECGSSKITPALGFTGPLDVLVKVSDGESTSGDVPNVFTITVGGTGFAPAFSSTPVTQATQGTAYSYQITATGNPGDGFTITADTALPSWLTPGSPGLSATTEQPPLSGIYRATLSGTPQQAHIGTTPLITLRVCDDPCDLFDTQSFTIVVADANDAPVITTNSLPAGTVGVAYSATVAATDADVPPDTLAFSATGLPPGLAISAAGAITGTPTTATGSPFAVSVTVNDGQGGTATASLPLVVNTPAPGNQPPVITTASLPAAIVGVAYNATVAATDADVPADTLAFSATGLPSGLAISAAGAITGTPTSATGSPFAVSVTVIDGRGGTATASLQLVVDTPVPGNRAPTINAPAAQTATVGQTYSLNVANGASDPDNDPLTFSATGLPPGITLSNAGVASGSPTTVGVSMVTATVNDGRGGTASATFQITVAAAPVTPPPTPPPSGGNGGGGSIGLGELLAMLLIGAMAGVRRRSSTAGRVR